MPFVPEAHPLQPYLRPLTIGLSILVLSVALSPLGDFLGCRTYLHQLFAPILYSQNLFTLMFYFAWKLFLRHGGLVTNSTKITRGWPVETMWSALLHQCASLLVFLLCVREPLLLLQSSDPNSVFTWWSSGIIEPYTWDTRFWDKLLLTMQLSEMYTDFILYGACEGFDLDYWFHHIMTFVAVMMVYCGGMPAGLGVFYASILEGGSVALNYNSIYPSKNGFRMRAICYTLSRGIAAAILPLSMYWSWTMSIVDYPASVLSHAPLVALILLNFSWLKAMIQKQLKVERGLQVKDL